LSAGFKYCQKKMIFKGERKERGAGGPLLKTVLPRGNHHNKWVERVGGQNQKIPGVDGKVIETYSGPKE